MSESDRPKRSRYMGHVYRIRYVSGLEGDKGDKLDGETDCDARLIKIEAILAAPKEREAMAHELLHQLLAHYPPMSGKSEEGLCTYLGGAIGAHIQQNPKFWAYLCRRIPNTSS